MSNCPILVVDDEEAIVDLVRFNLEEEGYDVDVSYDGSEALNMLRQKQYGLIVLDLMLPGVDGLEICRSLRKERGDRVGVIMLTARDQPIDRITGLNIGANDYVTKPFHPRELVARVNAVLRTMGNGDRDRRTPVRGLELDARAHRVTLDGEAVDLSVTEFRLLKVLMDEPGRVFSRQQLLDLAWDSDYVGSDRVVDVYIRYLRKKLDEPAGETFIETVRGVGYRFRARRSG